jgi:hypothetical protein
MPRMGRKMICADLTGRQVSQFQVSVFKLGQVAKLSCINCFPKSGTACELFNCNWGLEDKVEIEDVDAVHISNLALYFSTFYRFLD